MAALRKTKAKPRHGAKKSGKDARKGRSRRVKILLGLGLCLGVVLVALALYGAYLAIQIETRFAGRRWSIPSRIYSDVTMLYPGQVIRQSQLLDKLQRLGYRAVTTSPQNPGQYHVEQRAVEVLLRPVALPFLTRDAMRVVVNTGKWTLVSIRSVDDNKKLGLLDLEPEELLQVFGAERESRQLVTIDELPRHFVQAVLAAEDAEFYQHLGVDPLGIARALWVNIRAGKVAQGGSTITQQLAKNYFLSPERTLVRKLNELYIALLLELRYDKDEILEIYFNEIYMGQRGTVSVNGVGEAARFYFGKSAAQLGLAESATLAGLIKGPNLYSPHVNPERARQRRDRVLSAMHSQGWITQQQLDAARAEKLQPVEFAPYTRTAPYFFDYLQEQLVELYPKQALETAGMAVYTTLDAQVQRAAEQALQHGLERLERNNSKLRREDAAERLQGAVIVMQPKTGHILALVGGRDYGQSQFNRATQALRQPGSTFKPFVFAAALDSLTVATRLSNTARNYAEDVEVWSPKNYDGSEGEPVSMRQALAQSLNIPTVDLAMRIGLDRVIRSARDFGLTTQLQPRPSLALGAFEVKPLELARAYCAFAADGVLPFPLSVREVVDDQGRLSHRRHPKIHSVTSPAKAYLVTSMLTDAVRSGTAASLVRHGVDFPVAAKTGTTSDYRDAWFVGYTPDLLVLVWVGFDDNSSVRASGGRAALPIWAELVQQIPWLLSRQDFAVPPGLNQAVVCTESAELAVTTCPATETELFLQELTPTEPCPVHGNKNPLEALVDKVRERIGW